MSSTSLCRLCICAHSEFKNLYDEKVYEITVKYFDPMWLNSQQYPRLSSSICLECWQHIYDFDNYQQSVFNAQMEFERDTKQIIANIKLENSLPDEIETVFDKESYSEVNASEICLPQIDIIDVKIEENSFPLETNATDDNTSTMDLLEVLPKLPRKKGRLIKAENKRNLSAKSERQVKERVTGKKCRPNLPRKTKVTDTSKQIEKDTDPEILNDCSNVSLNSKDDCNESDNDVSSNDNKKSTKVKIMESDAFIAKWKPLLECDLCKQSFNNLTELQKHFSLEHHQQKCYVSCCQRKLVKRCHLVEHIRYHIDSNTFKCKVCEKVFTGSRNLNYHMRDLHTAEGQERSFECPLCQKRFTKKGALKAHLETHETDRSYKCSQCEKGFPTEQRRKIHESSAHDADRVCDQCGKNLRGVAALKRHMLEHDGVKKPKWPCDQCNAVLTSHYSLKRHKALHDSTNVYACDECGKISTSQMGLQSHIKYAHKLERKFRCTICDKAFKVAHVLREHMATHTGVDLYKCPHCPQTFKVNANMHHHRKKMHPIEWAEARANKVYTTRSGNS